MTTSAGATASPQHDWLTFHRVRLRSERALTAQDAVLPSRASGGRVGVDALPDDDGMPMQRGEVWAAFAIYGTREAAAEVFADPGRHFPFCADTQEAWHALLLPFAHRGEVDWRGHVETDAAIRCGPDSTGALAVITSAGYNAEAPDTAQRFVAFFERVCATRQAMASHSGNLATCLVANLDDRDGVTFTLWRGVDAMTGAAYGAGVHQLQVSTHRAAPLCDRTSFTRCRVVAHFGTWDGRDPLVEFVP